MVTLVVLNYNDADTTISYIERVKEYSCFDHIIVVDNCSTDNSMSELRTYETELIRVIQTDRNGGYGYGNNWGVKYAIENYASKYVLITNPDVDYSEDVVSILEKDIISKKNVGVVAPKMRNKDGSYSPLGAWKIPSLAQVVLINAKHPNKMAKVFGTRKYQDLLHWKGVHEVECVPGSMLLVDTNAFISSGSYDENIFLYGEETVLGIRMKESGFITLLDTNVSFLHNHSVSINKTVKCERKRMEVMWESRKYIIQRYYKPSFITRELIKLYAWYNIRQF